MPLSKPESRKLLHNRKINFQGFLRDDGLWDIEGHLVDTKSNNFSNDYRGGYIAAGEHIHEMWLRLTLDDKKNIVDADASIDYAPFAICPEITQAYKRLIGEKIGPGWSKRIREMFSGTNKCTHLSELLGPMASTAYQTMFSPQHDMKQLINTCHGHQAEDGTKVISNELKSEE